jgi:hypothetical protein
METQLLPEGEGEGTVHSGGLVEGAGGLRLGPLGVPFTHKRPTQCVHYKAVSSAR